MKFQNNLKNLNFFTNKIKDIKVHQFFYAVFVLLILMICRYGKVNSRESDPYGSLLTSQAIAQHGTIKLDIYEPILSRYKYQVYNKNGHFYYYFPIGTSVFAAPLVWLVNTLGTDDMVINEGRFQKTVFTMMAVLIFMLLVKVACLYLNPLLGVFTAGVFWLGTSLSSTGATALWSQDLSVWFSLLCLYFILKAHQSKQKPMGVWIGFFLFSAYLCRPTLALFAIFVLLYLLLIDYKTSLKAGLTLFLLLACFIAFSWNEFGQMLPDYYLPKRLDGMHFWLALYGNLFSPARGLFIYSSFLLTIFLTPGFLKQLWLQKQYLFLMLFTWSICHLITISRFSHWWAGHSFGPRFMMDVMPALYISFVFYINWLSKGRKYVLASITGVLICFSIFINSYQGIFNKYSALWNGSPNIDDFPEYLFDWKYPQFLHDQQRHEGRLKEHDLKYPTKGK